MTYTMRARTRFGAEIGTASELGRGFRASLPILIGIIPFALLLGAEAASKGLKLFEVPLMTGLNFAGGSEFAAIRLWTSPPNVLLIAGLTFLVNSRHLLMGAAIAPFLTGLSKRRILPALFILVDESWALGMADARQQGRLSLPFYLGAALPMWLVWVVFTALGAAVGPVLGDASAYGLELAFPAVFLVLLRSMWQGFRTARPWLVSLVVAATAHLLVPGA